jgi:hypothetical protein
MPIDTTRLAETITLNVVPVNEYSHSDVFTTSHQTFATLESQNIPSITATFTGGADCAERWLAHDGILVDGVFMEAVWSTKPRDQGPFTDSLYLSCQPLSAMPTYSPGVCPEGQTVAEVTEFQYSASSASGSQRLWQASCCKRYVMFQRLLVRLCMLYHRDAETG